MTSRVMRNEGLSAGRTGVFIDRDGTLNEERDFLKRPEDLRLVDGAGDAVRILNELGVVTCVISNQSGIARGYLTEKDLSMIHSALVEKLRADGARLDRIYYCPHHPTEGFPPYRIDCDCRKPKPGMLKTAQQEFNLDLSRSFVVGDKLDDIGAGKAVGATTILVLTGYGRLSHEMTKEGIAPDQIVPSLREAAEVIAGHMGMQK
jgi:D-glycero-D-manno-heptose 1,7-bisphosphate phosphatase